MNTCTYPRNVSPMISTTWKATDSRNAFHAHLNNFMSSFKLLPVDVTLLNALLLVLDIHFWHLVWQEFGIWDTICYMSLQCVHFNSFKLSKAFHNKWQSAVQKFTSRWSTLNCPNKFLQVVLLFNTCLYSNDFSFGC